MDAVLLMFVGLLNKLGKHKNSANFTDILLFGVVEAKTVPQNIL